RIADHLAELAAALARYRGLNDRGEKDGATLRLAGRARPPRTGDEANGGQEGKDRELDPHGLDSSRRDAGGYDPIPQPPPASEPGRNRRSGWPRRRRRATAGGGGRQRRRRWRRWRG